MLLQKNPQFPLFLVQNSEDSLLQDQIYNFFNSSSMDNIEVRPLSWKFLCRIWRWFCRIELMRAKELIFWIMMSCEPWKRGIVIELWSERIYLNYIFWIFVEDLLNFHQSWESLILILDDEWQDECRSMAWCGGCESSGYSGSVTEWEFGIRVEYWSMGEGSGKHS